MTTPARCGRRWRKTLLKVRHRTAYRYRRAVSLWPHRLMLCPRESRDLQVISCVVTVSPTAQARGRMTSSATPLRPQCFKARATVSSSTAWWSFGLRQRRGPFFNLAASAIIYPFRYSDDEWTDLGALTRQQYPDASERLAKWARAFVGGERTDTLALLKDLCAGTSGRSTIRAGMTKVADRDLDRSWGSRRDFAVLSKRRAVWASARGRSQATFSIPARCSSDRRTPDQRTPGAKSLCGAPGGSALIRRTAASAVRTSFQPLSHATFSKHPRCPEPMRETATLWRAWRWGSS